MPKSRLTKSEKETKWVSFKLNKLSKVKKGAQSDIVMSVKLCQYNKLSLERKMLGLKHSSVL